MIQYEDTKKKSKEKEREEKSEKITYNHGINKRRIGADYEAVASDFLAKNGYEIIEHNYHCRIGEIDIIARDYSGNENTLVFIEVKYRKTQKYGSPLEAVDIKKQKTIMAVAAYYIREKKIKQDISIRYDVVGILGDDIQLIKNAFGSM